MGLLGALFSKRLIPPPSGEHAVGTTRVDVTAQGWLDRSAPSPMARKLAVQAWYPAQPTDAPTEPYLDDTLRAALSQLTRVPKFLLPQNPSFSVPNEPAVPGRFPVLVFNHGFASFQKQSTSLLEELASHGYLVLSIGHPFESLVVQYADGTAVQHRAELPAWRAISAGLKDLEKNAGEVAPLLARARAAATPEQLREAMRCAPSPPTRATGPSCPCSRHGAVTPPRCSTGSGSCPHHSRSSPTSSAWASSVTRWEAWSPASSR